MSEPILVDNDVALKLCAYSCAKELVDLVKSKDKSLAMLGVARYSIGRRVQRARNIYNPDALKHQWAMLSESLIWIEPTTEEIAFAAELEQQAIEMNVELDGGESQLFAILVYRLSPLLLTGDKRAIAALEMIGQAFPTEKVACLEQIVYTLLKTVGAATLQSRICCEPAVDRSICLAFGCNTKADPVSVSSIETGLMSYIGSVRASAPQILTQANDLSAIVS